MTVHVSQRQDRIRSRRERRKQVRQARIRRQILRYCLLLTLLCFGASLFVCLSWRLLDIDRDILVSGNHVVTVEQVRGVLANCEGKLLFRLDPRRLARQVQSLADVRYAFVRRYLLPHPHLVVQVLEEYPWASLASAPDQPPKMVIAESGKLIPISEFPLVVQPAFKICGPVDIKFSADQVAKWAEWSSSIACQTGETVEYLDMRQPQNICVKTTNLFLKIGMPDTSLGRRIGRLASLMPYLEQFADKLECIDLALDNNIPLKIVDKESHKVHQEIENKPLSPSI